MGRSNPLTAAQDRPMLVDPDDRQARPEFTSAIPGSPGPQRIAHYTRRRLAEAMPLIATKLIERAIDGGLAELKLMVQIAGIDSKQPQSDPAERKFGGRYFEDILMDQWRKEQAREAGESTDFEPSGI